MYFDVENSRNVHFNSAAVPSIVYGAGRGILSNLWDREYLSNEKIFKAIIKACGFRNLEQSQPEMFACEAKKVLFFLPNAYISPDVLKSLIDNILACNPKITLKQVFNKEFSPLEALDMTMRDLISCFQIE